MAEIRNYTLNFSFDITFMKRKLVFTETRCARFGPDNDSLRSDIHG